MPYQADDNARPRHTPLVGTGRHASGPTAQAPSSAGTRTQARHARTNAAQTGAAGQAASAYGTPRSHQPGYSRTRGESATRSPYGAHSSARAGERQARLERARAARRAQRRRRTIAAVAGVLAVLALGFFLLRPHGGTGTTPSGTGGTGTPSTPAETTDTPAETTPTEAELRIEEVRARAAANCTREQPSGLTDPAEYAALGKATMEGIVSRYKDDEGFDNAWLLKLDAVTDWDGNTVPYLVAVNRAANVVTVYALDADNRYTVPYMAMACSTGDATPLGIYYTDDKYSWQPLFEEVFGQYATHVVGNILFHSVPYYNPNKDDVEYAEYNKLGTAASLGCVRLQVCDVKWIYDMCPLGTPIVFYDDAANPSPMGRPGTIATNETDTDPSSATYRGFDPTDPDSSNPWDPAYRSGTAIRSDAAQAEWEAAQADGRWSGSITPTDLLGASTDAESRG